MKTCQFAVVLEVDYSNHEEVTDDMFITAAHLALKLSTAREALGDALAAAGIQVEDVRLRLAQRD